MSGAACVVASILAAMYLSALLFSRENFIANLVLAISFTFVALVAVTEILQNKNKTLLFTIGMIGIAVGYFLLGKILMATLMLLPAAATLLIFVAVTIKHLLYWRRTRNR